MKKFDITSNDLISIKIQKALANKCKQYYWESSTTNLYLKIYDEDEFQPADGQENVKKMYV